MIPVLLFLVLLLTPLPAAANAIFDWTGTCVTVCMGQATLHVVLSDAYVPGTSVAFPPPSLLLEALYTDNVLSFDLTGLQWQVDAQGLQVPTTTQPSVIRTMVDEFRSNVDGTWRFGGESLLGKLPGCVVDPNPCFYRSTGIGGVWVDGPAAVPWPGGLFVAGLALLIAARGAKSRKER